MDQENSWNKRYAEAGEAYLFGTAPNHFLERRAALFETPEGRQKVEADVFVLALGGASWPRLGADGSWVAPLAAAGLASSPLRPANCGMIIDWSQHFIEKFEGQPLKNIALRFDEVEARGDLMVTRRGLEGGAVYALSGAIREALAAGSEAQIEIDLRELQGPCVPVCLFDLRRAVRPPVHLEDVIAEVLNA